jgi:ketosteroid isomerase-like protein
MPDLTERILLCAVISPARKESEMIERTEQADVLELSDLSYTYARSIDRTEADAFVSVFHPDARLTVFTDGTGDTVRNNYAGLDELRTIPHALTRFDRTYHFVGNRLYEIDGDDARGEVYCIAHHLSSDSSGSNNYVMLIRYLDQYRRDAVGGWKINHRIVRPDWTENRRANE